MTDETRQMARDAVAADIAKSRSLSLEEATAIVDAALERLPREQSYAEAAIAFAVAWRRLRFALRHALARQLRARLEAPATFEGEPCPTCGRTTRCVNCGYCAFLCPPCPPQPHPELARWRERNGGLRP